MLYLPCICIPKKSQFRDISVKIILLLISLIGTSWTLKLTSVPKCPIDEPSANLPHENCSKYYSCSYGKLTEHDCPPGLHFRPETNVNT